MRIFILSLVISSYCLSILGAERLTTGISTMPSITQVFSYLKLEDNLKGVSKFCTLKKKEDWYIIRS